jgi:hypothetical protein
LAARGVITGSGQSGTVLIGVEIDQGRAKAFPRKMRLSRAALNVITVITDEHFDS